MHLFESGLTILSRSRFRELSIPSIINLEWQRKRSDLVEKIENSLKIEQTACPQHPGNSLPRLSGLRSSTLLHAEARATIRDYYSTSL